VFATIINTIIIYCSHL